MTASLEDKVALVTGGSSGIGRATALAFAQAGAKVVIADVDVEGGEETQGMIKDANGEAIFVKTDVSKAAEVKAGIAKAVQTYGQLDCALNNAGIEGPTSLTADHTEEEFDQVISINLKGIWLCMKYEIPQMLQHGGGVIVNMSSFWGLVGAERAVAYCASKHGVVGLTKTAAIEYARSGIRVNAVCPGAVHTPMRERIKIIAPETLSAEKNPDIKVAMPEDIAGSVVWLCSDAASFVTGHAMAIDDGLLAR